MRKKEKKIKLPSPSTFGDELVNSFGDFFERVDRGETLTLRTVALDLHVRDYTKDDIRKIRLSLHVSQGVMAKLLGVSILTIQSWEQGTRKPSQMACRFLDEIASFPEHWIKRLSNALISHPN